MKKEDGQWSFSAFMKNLFGKQETNAPNKDAEQEYDRSDYYTGNYSVSRDAAEDEQTEQAENTRERDAGASEFEREPNEDDIDDFSFVDSEDEGIQTDYERTPDVATDEGEEESVDADANVDTAPVDYEIVVKATLDDLLHIADLYLDGVIMIVDVEDTDVDQKVRMFDFLSGLVYATNGSIEKKYEGKAYVILPEGCTFDDVLRATENSTQDEEERNL